MCGIVEADETFFLFSRKGERQLDRPARPRGGRAEKPGLSKLVPVFVADDPVVHARRRPARGQQRRDQSCPETGLAPDALLVTDGDSYYRQGCQRSWGEP